MKKLLISIMIFIILVSVTGCEKYAPKREDIENLNMIKLVGVDKQKNKIRLILASKSTKPSGGNGSPEIESDILVSDGNTIFDAARLMHAYSNKRPFFGMAEQLIMGESTAKDGIRAATDFFMRDHELRLDMEVFVVKSGSAEEIITNSAGKKLFMGDVLRILSEARGDISMSTEVQLFQLSTMLDSKTSSVYLPCLQMVSGTEQTGSEPSNSLKLMGLAVFKDDKLSYYLDGYETRGFNWVKGDIESGIITVKDPAGEEVSLEIITASRKIKTYIDDGIPRVDVSIKISSNVGEQWSADDIYNDEAINLLKSEQEKIIKSEVLKVISIAQKRNTDIFGFGDTIYHQHPGKWKEIEDRWEEIFPIIKVNVNVESKINRTYDIEKPSQYEKKGKLQ